MQFNTFASCQADLEACARTQHIREVLLETKHLAREGRLALEEAVALADSAQALGLKPVLVWDILMNDDDFSRCSQVIASLPLDRFSAVRVQCIGAAHYLHETYPKCPIQLIAETANCNRATLEMWCRMLGTQLQRIVLSIQLPAETIAAYVRALPVECEILGLGKILLFYSERNLLRNHFEALGEEWREVLAEADESGSRPFPVIDNTHGTFMYLDKDQCILDKLDALKGACPHYLRLDLRHIREFPESARGIEEFARLAVEQPEELRRTWPRPTRAPFFKSNLTTKQFKLLNSEVRLSRDEQCVAEIVSTERGSHCVLRAIQSFTVPGRFRVIDPSGREILCEFGSLRYLSGSETTTVSEDELVLGPWLKAVSGGSLVLKA